MPRGPDTTHGKRAIRDIMRRTDAVLHPDHPLDEARTRLSEAGLSFAPVADGEQVVAVVTLQALATGTGEAEVNRDRVVAVRDRMTSTVPFLYEDETVATGRAVARSAGTGHFCVVDRDHRLVGLIDFEDPATIHAAATDRSAPETGDAAALAGERTPETAARASAAPPGEVASYADRPVVLAPESDPKRRRHRH